MAALGPNYLKTSPFLVLSKSLKKSPLPSLPQTQTAGKLIAAWFDPLAHLAILRFRTGYQTRLVAALFAHPLPPNSQILRQIHRDVAPWPAKAFCRLLPLPPMRLIPFENTDSRCFHANHLSHPKLARPRW